VEEVAPKESKRRFIQSKDGEIHQKPSSRSHRSYTGDIIKKITTTSTVHKVYSKKPNNSPNSSKSGDLFEKWK
jgi:hypothetical protein